MTHIEIIKTVMAQSGVTQKDLTDRLGLASQARVSERINRKNCTVKGLVALLEGLECELIVRAPDGREYVIKADDYV